MLEHMQNNDMLVSMIEQQENFMRLLQEKRGFPTFPVDIQSKDGQRFLKGITFECMDELFEANKELKNSKSHRQTNIDDFNRDAYIEELSDALHYFFEIVIASGISTVELYESYMKKGNVNFDRINFGY
jgi:hypothetical protein